MDSDVQNRNFSRLTESHHISFDIAALFENIFSNKKTKKTQQEKASAKASAKVSTEASAKANASAREGKTIKTISRRKRPQKITHLKQDNGKKAASRGK